jgi:hypothetical protein
MNIDTRILFLAFGMGLFYGWKKAIITFSSTLIRRAPLFSFINEITETKGKQYEYLYNGGGAGIGDFNRDTLPKSKF